MENKNGYGYTIGGQVVRAGGSPAPRKRYTGKVEFIGIGQFIMANGRAPRGRGRWAFAMGRDYREVDELAEDGKPRVIWVGGGQFDTYSQCKHQAEQIARARGFDRVWVCS